MTCCPTQLEVTGPAVCGECHHQGDAFSEACDIQLEISVGAEGISVGKSRVSSRASSQAGLPNV